MTLPEPRRSVLVIGAGIGGCAAALALTRKGHAVRVLESQPDLNEFGAGVQMMPNAVRILTAWGLKEEFEPLVDAPEWLELRKADGALLQRLALNVKGYYEDFLGAPPDYQRVLAAAARERGAEIIFSAKVIDVNTTSGTVSLENGMKYTADLVVGADGIRSKVRTAMPEKRNAQPLGFSEQCWRALIPRKAMLSHPETATLIEKREYIMWSAEGRWLLCYTICAGEVFNIVASFRSNGDAPTGSFNIPGDPDEFRAMYSDFLPTVTKLLSLVETCAKWKLAHLPLLDSFASGKTVLLGDAAHAMLPHVASGANLAIEDAAVLAECLDYPHGIQAYEELRKPRTHRIGELALIQATTFSLGGTEEERRRRQEAMAKAAKNTAAELELSREERQEIYRHIRGDNMWAENPAKEWSKWIFGYDAIGEAQKFFKQSSQAREAH